MTTITTMTTKSIKISEEIYSWLIGVSGELQKNTGKMFTIDETLKYIKNSNKINSVKTLINLAGSWKMDDKEAEKLKKDIKRGWKNWKTKSA